MPGRRLIRGWWTDFNNQRTFRVGAVKDSAAQQAGFDLENPKLVKRLGVGTVTVAIRRAWTDKQTPPPDGSRGAKGPSPAATHVGRHIEAKTERAKRNVGEVAELIVIRYHLKR